MLYWEKPDMILFSIIIPTYNRAAFLEKAIGSIIAQSHAHWELIVIDDASTDQTAGLLERYQDERISVYRNPVNIERSASRNRGIELAKGDYICFLDSDDYYLPDHLSLLVQYIESHAKAKALFHTGVKQINLGKQTEQFIDRPAYPNQVEGVLSLHIPVISVAIHRDILKEYQFDPQLKINEDVHLFARIAARYPVIYCPGFSVVWVLHGSNTINNEIDYITPQLLASRMIFKDPLVSLQLSSFYKRQKYFSLYSQLVYFHATNKRHGLAALCFVKGLWLMPLNKNNITNLLNVLYHLPGGRWLKRTMQLFN